MTRRNVLEFRYNLDMEMETRTCLCGCGNTFRVATTNKTNYFDSLNHALYALDAGSYGQKEAQRLMNYRRSKSPNKGKSQIF